MKSIWLPVFTFMLPVQLLAQESRTQESTAEEVPAWIDAEEPKLPEPEPKPRPTPKKDRKIYLRFSGGAGFPTRGPSAVYGKGAFDLELHFPELDGIIVGANATAFINGDGYTLFGNGMIGMLARVFETPDWIGHGSLTVLFGGGGGSFGGTADFEARCELRALGWRTLETFVQFGFSQFRDANMLTLSLGLSLAFL